MKVEQNSISLSLFGPLFTLLTFLLSLFPLFSLFIVSSSPSHCLMGNPTRRPLRMPSTLFSNNERKWITERERERKKERCIAEKTLSGEWIRINCQRDFRENKIIKGEELTVERTRVNECEMKREWVCERERERES